MENIINYSLFIYLLTLLILITPLEWSQNSNVKHIKTLFGILTYFGVMATGYTIGILPALGTWVIFTAYSMGMFYYVGHLRVNVYKIPLDEKNSFLSVFIMQFICWPFSQGNIHNVYKFSVLRKTGAISPHKTEKKLKIKSVDQLLQTEFNDCGYCYGVSYRTDLKFRNSDAVQMLAHDIGHMDSHIPPNGIKTYLDHMNIDIVAQGLKTLKTLNSPNHTILKNAMNKVEVDEEGYIETENYNDLEDWDQWDYDDENRFKEFLEENRDKFK
ncbi:hypothetical protein LNTAR_21735 [Lentisphaera araneosa HTCC2155]|uniref:Uncharacterized protein n=1 Tax=Lentisphaera araneosa HTCC2155 TaxID=313628 RepID=A6DM81_9BACT|nr:hypothetical protein [Lentisphaera araneosa]EDM27379.1 hypothetical protein LNTAR_21735 [Lentisphaera araneosa HTCC2155]